MNTTEYGSPFPLGATKVPSGWNFAVYSTLPVNELVIAPLKNPKEITSFLLDPEKNHTSSIWHIFVPTIDTELLYAFKVSETLLIDPYAKLIASGSTWQANAFGNERYKTNPLGVAFAHDDFDWDGDKAPKHHVSNLIIYEMHLRGFTKNQEAHVQNPGTYLGVIEKIPYLKQLGINAVEFLPIFEFDESDCICFNPKTKKRLCNYWGYQPLSFFSPMQRFATSDDPLKGLHECKLMIKELHKAGIEVILDIVFNHTGEGNQYGRTISWKGFSENEYYLKGHSGEYLNYSGCGNTLNCNHPIVADMIIESLRYWVTELHVDGFRFDLASILTRGQDGRVLESSPLLDRITHDVILSHTKLIAEPWDAAGLHQVGKFIHPSWKTPDQWMEWNDDFRTSVRQFLKGTPGYAGKFATKICGSEDLYGTQGKPLNSLNYICCHDGFTLLDLVSYEHKHNLDNGEENKDGMIQYDTWNCGHEGKTNDPEIEALRQRQMKNFCIALLVSCGVPMIHSGDEYGHTKNGNNNTWCQDNDLSWFDWKEVSHSNALLSFWKKIIAFRQSNLYLKRRTFFKPEDIIWHGLKPNTPDWGQNVHFVAFTIIDHAKLNHIYVAFNASDSWTTVLLPHAPNHKKWTLIANTSNLPPYDIVSSSVHKFIEKDNIQMGPYSSLILKAF